MKNNKKLRAILVLLLVLSLGLTGCKNSDEANVNGESTPAATSDPGTTSGTDNPDAGNENGTGTEADPGVKSLPINISSIPSDSLYVSKVENMSDDFILGMDASCVPSLEAGGVKYYDFDGTETDVYQVLAQSGINYIRVRVWNDPYDANGNGYGGGNCDIDNCVEIGKRATAAGLKLLVDFHYSDFWADPAKQMVPKAWKGMEIDEKKEALYEYTKDCLLKLKDAGVDVGMVQVGNETNGAMCGEKIWMNIYYLMDAGSRAVREIYPEALVAVHFANPEKVTNYAEYAKKLNYYKLDYDVFASSYYPFWHGTLDNLAEVLNNITETYGKKVMVAETSYAFTSEDSDFNGNTISGDGGIVKAYPFSLQGQANLVRDVIDTTVNKMTAGIGVFYWEGTWISAGGSSWEENSALWEKYGSGWASSYASEYDPDDAGKYYGGCAVDNQAFFDATGHPLESLKVWGLTRYGNVVATRADAIQDTNLIIDLAADIVLPETVSAVMTDNSKQEVKVVWEEPDYDLMHSSGPAKYEVKGTADGMEAHCYISMVEFNFLNDYSFENDGEGWVAADLTGHMNELYVENKVTDSMTGDKHFHFWSEKGTKAEFTLEQEVSDLPAGRYKFTISIMGGDGGREDIYMYVKLNDEIVLKQSMQITKYNEWDTKTIDGIEYNGTDKIAVGIYVCCEGDGNGPWGKIDDAMLNSSK